MKITLKTRETLKVTKPPKFPGTFKWAKDTLAEWRMDNPDSDVTWEHVEEFCITRIQWTQFLDSAPESDTLLITARASELFERMEYNRGRLPERLVELLTIGNVW